MSTDSGRAVKGSKKWLQTLVSDCPWLLNDGITSQLPGPPTNIDWRAPLPSSGYKEPRDEEFLERLQESRFLRRPLPSWSELYSFWPKSGPRWDALGVTDHGQLLLVEAKSHVAELVSSSGAKDPHSISKISSSLDRTKQAIGRKSAFDMDWTTGVYQYANRLAHLYFFHRLHRLDTYLLLLCFVNDTEMSNPDTFVPTTPEQWESALVHQERMMGIRQRHSLSDRIIHVFIDVESIPIAGSA